MIKTNIEDIIEEKYTRYLNCETDIIELTLEEAIFILEKDKKNHYVEELLQEAYKVILSDYKRILKENEELISDNLEYQRIQDIFDKRTYRKKYLEERRKEEPNLLYPDADEIYRRYYELQKENEELKFNERSRVIGKIGDVEIHDLINRVLSNDYIPVQKVKEKIEELKEDKDSKYYYIFLEERDIENTIKILQELLDNRK